MFDSMGARILSPRSNAGWIPPKLLTTNCTDLERPFQMGETRFWALYRAKLIKITWSLHVIVIIGYSRNRQNLIHLISHVKKAEIELVNIHGTAFQRGQYLDCVSYRGTWKRQWPILICEHIMFNHLSFTIPCIHRFSAGCNTCLLTCMTVTAGYNWHNQSTHELQMGQSGLESALSWVSRVYTMCDWVGQQTF